MPLQQNAHEFSMTSFPARWENIPFLSPFPPPLSPLIRVVRYVAAKKFCRVHFSSEQLCKGKITINSARRFSFGAADLIELPSAAGCGCKINTKFSRSIEGEFPRTSSIYSFLPREEKKRKNCVVHKITFLVLVPRDIAGLIFLGRY